MRQAAPMELDVGRALPGTLKCGSATLFALADFLLVGEGVEPSRGWLEARPLAAVPPPRERERFASAGLCPPRPSRRLTALCFALSHDRLPYHRRYRRDSDAYRFEERSPSFGEDYYSSRSRNWRRSRGREQHRPKKHQHYCRKRRTRSCSSASSVSSIQNELGMVQGFNCASLLSALNSG